MAENDAPKDDPRSAPATAPETVRDTPTARPPSAPPVTAALESVAWSRFERGTFGSAPPAASAPVAPGGPSAAPPARKSASLLWLGLVPIAGLLVIGGLVALSLYSVSVYNAGLREYVTTVNPTPCPAPAR